MIFAILSDSLPDEKGLMYKQNEFDFLVTNDLTSFKGTIIAGSDAVG